MLRSLPLLLLAPAALAAQTAHPCLTTAPPIDTAVASVVVTAGGQTFVGGAERGACRWHPTADALAAEAPTAVPIDASLPELPRVRVDVTMPVSTRVLAVHAGGKLQAALDSAQPGDAIVLDDGAVYRGAFVLRAKAGAGWIVIRGATLPAAGRMTPAAATALPRLVMPSGGNGAVSTAPGASGYRLVGLEIAADSVTRSANALVRLYTTTVKALDDYPSRIVLDRVYVHGGPTLQLTRCVLGNGVAIAVVDSYLSECHAKGHDSQAFVSWDGPGPYLLAGNYLEGAGENVMFGGAPPSAAAFVPADIVIVHNHITKPLAWLASKQWTIKNALELKDAQRVLVEGNVIENVWVDAQTGRAILIRAADQTTAAPWPRTKDITIRYNVLRHSASGFSIDAQGPVEGTSRVLIEQNLISDIGDRALGSGGALFQLTGSVAHVGLTGVTIRRNTATFSTGNAVRATALVLDGGPHVGVTVTGNVLELGNYGIKGSGAASGVAAVLRYLGAGAVSGNVLYGAPLAAAYAGLGTLAALPSAVTALLAPLTGVGADVPAVLARTAGVVIP